MTVVSKLGNVSAAYTQVGDRYRITLRSHQRLSIRSAATGRGRLLCRWVDGEGGYWQAGFSLMEERPAAVQAQETAGETFVTVDIGPVFPCAGFFTGDMQGVLFSPACKLDIPMHPDLWVMVLEPPDAPFRVVPARTFLRIFSEEAEATASLQGGEELVCHLNASGPGFRRVRLLLERELSGIRTAGAVLGQLESGSIVARWSPSRGSFGETIWVTDTAIGHPHLLTLLEHLGAPVRRRGLAGYLRGYLDQDFVLADGPPLDYTLRLVMDRPLRPNLQEQTRVSLQFGPRVS